MTGVVSYVATFSCWCFFERGLAPLDSFVVCIWISRILWDGSPLLYSFLLYLCLKQVHWRDSSFSGLPSAVVYQILISERVLVRFCMSLLLFFLFRDSIFPLVYLPFVRHFFILFCLYNVLLVYALISFISFWAKKSPFGALFPVAHKKLWFCFSCCRKCE